MSKESLRTGVVVDGQIEPVRPGELFSVLTLYQMGKERYQKAEILNLPQMELEHIERRVSELLKECDMLTGRYVETSQN